MISLLLLVPGNLFLDMKTKFRGVKYRPAQDKLRTRFQNQDDPAVARAYVQAQEERAERLGWGESDPVFSHLPPAYLASICINGKPRHLGSTQDAESAARLYDAALFHLWGFVRRGKNPSRFNFYKLNDPVPEFSPKLRMLRRQLIRELTENPYKNKEGYAQHTDNFDFNFLNEQNT